MVFDTRALQRKPKRTREPPPVGSRMDLRTCAGCGACPLASAIFPMTRSSMSRNPVSQTGKSGASPERVANSSPASIEVMQQAFNLLSTEHYRGGGPFSLRSKGILPLPKKRGNHRNISSMETIL